MQFKKLQIGADLQECISYNNDLIPLAVCVDNLDEYFQREWECHWHDEFEFGIIQKGSAEFTIYDSQETVAKTLHQGDGIFIGSGCLHSVKAMEPDTVIAGFVLPINFFDVGIFENIFWQNIQPMIEAGINHIFLSADVSADRLLLSGIQELCMINKNETGYELHLMESACKIWHFLIERASLEKKAKISSANKVQEQRVKAVLSFIHAHYGEHICIDDMAKASAISRTECFRCFQTVLGKSPVEYLTEYRLSMATTMLVNSERTLSEISNLCGFNSPSYFGKLFRKRCGLSPKKYRKQTQNFH